MIRCQQIGLWPRLDPEEVEISAADLACRICNFEVIRITRHSRCMSEYDFNGGVGKVIDRVGSPVLQSHRIHMAAVAGK